MDSYSQWGSKVAMAWLDITPKSHNTGFWKITARPALRRNGLSRLGIRDAKEFRRLTAR
jgi:hypothetical protein